jgi:flagellar basal-body rod protein FlgB
MMIDALFSQNNYVATKKMLDVTALRHEAIASNLANLETPGYKRVDVDSDFQGQLQQAITSQNTGSISSLQPRLMADTDAEGTTTRDGNNVQLETELIHLNQNTLAHTMETQLVSATLAKLRSAISGQAT